MSAAAADLLGLAQVQPRRRLDRKEAVALVEMLKPWAVIPRWPAGNA
jgi:hypothetical protein